MNVQIPANPLRWYQIPFFAYMQNGGKEACLVQSRRSGKDYVSSAWNSWAAYDRPANYWHLMPQQNQIRKAFWKGVDANSGKRILDIHYPREIFPKRYEQDMMIEAPNGSTIQFMGSDNPDALVGSGIAGVTISEGAVSNPLTMGYITPMLAENDGWLVVNSTPRGKNWFYDYYMQCLADPDAFTTLLTAEDCQHISAKNLERERRRKSKGLFLQEYMCSFDHGMEGSIYLDEMGDMLKDGRITEVPYDKAQPVYTAWDIGYDDVTAIVFFQVGLGGMIYVIDYYEDRQISDLSEYVKVLNSKDYNYGMHFLPHDGAHQRLGMESISKQLRDKGHKNRVVPRVTELRAGLEFTKVALGKTSIDAKKADKLVNGLNAYRYEYDDKLNRYKPKPLHDWASDPADSFRTAAHAVKLGWCNIMWQDSDLDYSALDAAAI